LRLWLFLILT